MNKPYLKYGLLLAVCNALWIVIIYLVGMSHSLWGLLLTFMAIIFAIIFCVMAIKEERNADGGYITFGRAFITGFLTLLISGVVGILFNYIYTQFIDTEYLQYMSRELPVSIAQKFGAPEEQLDKLREQMEATPLQTYDLWYITKAILGSAFFGAFFGLIIGAIMKRNKPIELM
jgi:hypothetical protein